MVTDSVALPGSAFQVPLPDLPHKHVGVRLFVFGASEKGPYDHVREVFFLARMSVMNAHPQLKKGLGKPSPSMIKACFHLEKSPRLKLLRDIIYIRPVLVMAALPSRN